MCEELVGQEDSQPGQHIYISIGPFCTMTYDGYVEVTQSKWQKVTKIETKMQLIRDFLQTLQNGATHPTLLDIVRYHHQSGMSTQESYRLLEQLWQELGFDDSDEDSELRDNLEFVMEKIWFRGAG